MVVVLVRAQLSPVSIHHGLLNHSRERWSSISQLEMGTASHSRKVSRTTDTCTYECFYFWFALF